MGRRYRKRTNAGAMIRETTSVCSSLPWWGALTLGALLFSLFYFALPMYLEAKLAESSGSRITIALEAIIGRRLHWSQWLGYALGIVGLYFAIRNYLVSIQAGNLERGSVGIFARILGRSID